MVAKLDYIPIGSKIVSDIYSPFGTLLYMKNEVITSDMKSTLKDIGIETLEVDIGVNDFISDKSSLRKLSNMIYTMVMNCNVTEIARISYMFVMDMANNSLSKLLKKLYEYSPYTYNHSIKVSQYSMIIGSMFDVKLDHMKCLCKGGLLHDIGKIKVPKDILHKPGKLTSDEFDIIKMHPIEGVKIAISNGITNPNILDIIGQHHERWDGSGYPRGLYPRAVNKLANICHMADVYCALNEKRDYKDRLGRNKLWEIMDSMAKSHFEESSYEMVRNKLPMYFVGEKIYFVDGSSAVVIGDCDDDNSNPRVSYNGRIESLQDIGVEKWTKY